MNKNILIGAGITLVVLGIAGYYLFAGSRNGNQTIAPNNAASRTENISLKNLMQMGGNQQCTFHDSESNTSGIVYVGSEQTRADFQSEIDGVMTNSHMISDGQSQYIWVEGQPQGFKTDINALENMAADTNVGTSQTVDVNKNVEYSCQPWSVDNGLFSPPSNVEFQDVSGMMQEAGQMIQEAQTAEGMMQDNSTACAACDSVPAEAQAQCRAALNCN